MTGERDRELATLIRSALPPVGEPPPPADLWPRLSRRLGPRLRPGHRLDWVLALIALALLIRFPEAWLAVFYHL